MFIEIVGVYVIRQSKRTPRTARFLISGIIMFKLSGHIIFIIAKFLLKSEHVIRGFLHIVTSFVVLVIVTHALMSIERFVVFSAYRMHFRITGSSRARNSVIIFWLSLWLLNTFIRFTFCGCDAKVFGSVLGPSNGVILCYFLSLLLCRTDALQKSFFLLDQRMLKVK